MPAPHEELVFLPLGGAGEIGMNLNLYGYAGKWLMVDLGITFGDDSTPGVDVVQVWMPDSRRLVFTSERAGVRNLFWQAADGAGTAERLTESGQPYVIEANPNPQIARGEDFAEAAEAAGLDYPALITRLLALALAWEPARAG